MEVFLAALAAIGIFIGGPALIGLLITGGVVWYNKRRTARAKESLTSGATTFAEEVASVYGSDGFARCIQCGTCSGSCPNANEMEFAPRQIIAMVRAGMRKEVLSSDSMWYCASCYMCAERCPRGIKVTDLMYSLKQLAYRNGFRYGPTGEPIMYRTFVDLINQNGRVHEVGLTGKYYMQSKPMAILKMAPIGVKMFMRGRTPLRPHVIENKEQLTAIITKARELEAARVPVGVRAPHAPVKVGV